MSDQNRENRIKKLQYVSWYRGCKETDKILGGFARVHLEGLNDNELDLFEAILDESDKDLFNWLSGTEPLPEEYHDNAIMQRILAFDVSSLWK